MNRLIVCLAVAGLLIAPAVMKAQTGTATISGAITDPTGAAIADATVRVRNVNTGIERVVKTNQQGLYVVDRLLPGEYEIIVEKPGFKRFARREVVLQIDQRARHDIALEIGAVQEVIEVTAGAAQFLKPESSELSQVIEEDTVEELPLNGRNTFELIALNSGVGTTTNSFFKGIGIDLSLNGQRPSTNNFLIGGMDNIEFISNAPNNTVQPDAVAEFNVLTNNFSAEYGRAVGGVVNLQMRSGTNEFHGTLFEFLRNDVLDATDFFTNKAGEKKNPFRFNQFGGTLGGPIVKNRTFFFAGYQGTWIVTSNTALLSVPPLAWRSGDFSSLLADGIQIYDPTTVVGTIGIFPIRAAFPGNIIPAASQNPVGRAILDLYPAPNRPGTFQNYVTPLGSETKTSDIDVKVDHKFTDNHFIAGRMNLTDFKLEQDSFFGDIGGGGSFPKQLTDNLNLGLTYTSILSPSVLNEFRFGYLRRKNDVISSGFGQNLNEQLGIPGLNVSEETSGLAWICPIGFDCL
ncbi:MAG: TonB-dependent receptor plug domain-containing protein, partial [Nitrospinaceae bacterium]|nr:TonB-dependent receptor plug domain-containing protein [Nitrospinaceae bacterium]